MKMQQVSAHCYAVLNETNLVCDANSGLVNLGDGLLIDTQSDLAHCDVCDHTGSCNLATCPGRISRPRPGGRAVPPGIRRWSRRPVAPANR